MGIQIQQILDEVGWTDGFHIPVADDDNRKLEQELEEKIKRKNAITSQLAELKERLETTQKHYKNVETEQQQNQALLCAHRAELEAERNMARVAESERSRLQQEARNFKKAANDVKQRCDALEKEKKVHEERVEKLKAAVKMDRQSLTEWEEELARGEEGTGLLERFTAEDDKEARDLEVERLRLKAEVDERKRILDSLCTDTAAAETSLERSAQLFRQQHRERRDLVAQWETTVRELRKRDDDIRRVLDEMAVLRTTEREREEEAAEQQRFYDNEVANYQEMEAQTEQTTRVNAMLTESNAALEKTVEEMMQALLLMRRDLEAAGRKLDEDRAGNIQAQRTITANTKRLETTRTATRALEAGIAGIKTECGSAQQRVREIEELMKAEERYLKSLINDLERANKLKLNAESKLLEIKKQEELQHMEMQAINSTKEGLRMQLNRIEKELKRQQEVLYNLEFEATRLEGRIMMVSGITEIPNMAELEEKLRDTEDALQEKNEVYNLLTGQVKQLEDTMRRFTATMGIDERELLRLEDRRQDGLLLTEGGAKHLKAARSRYQEKQVEESVLRLRVRQAEEALNREGDALYSLERQRLELENLMKERKVEIAVHAEMMTAKKRCVQEESARLNMEINGRRVRSDQLRKKFELAETAMGHDECGEVQDLTELRIQIAQEKYLLQHKGDELDAEIRQAEKEIQALENTLKVLNATNDTYKKNLSAIDEEAPEYQEKLDLEQEIGESMEKIRAMRATLQSERRDSELQDLVLESEESNLDEARRVQHEEERLAEELEKDLEEQQVKLDRAAKQVRQLTKELRGRRRTAELSLEERDIDLRELTEQNRAATTMLVDLRTQHPEIMFSLAALLKKHDLELPVTKDSSLAPSRLTLHPSGTEVLEVQSRSLGATTSSSRTRSVQSSARSNTTSSNVSLSGGSVGSVTGRVGDTGSGVPTIVNLELSETSSMQTASSSTTTPSSSSTSHTTSSSTSSELGNEKFAKGESRKKSKSRK